MGNNIKDIQQIKSLIAKGKEMGFLTFEEVNKAVPLEMNTPEQFEEIIGIFDQLEIAIVDLEKDGKKIPVTSAETDGEQSEERLELVDNEDAADFSSRSTDPVRMYLREMGAVPLLDRDGEVTIAKKIEQGEQDVLYALVEVPVAVEELINVGEDLKLNRIKLKDVVKTIEEDDPTEDEMNQRTRVILLLEEIRQTFKKKRKIYAKLDECCTLERRVTAIQKEIMAFKEEIVTRLRDIKLEKTLIDRIIETVEDYVRQMRNCQRDLSAYLLSTGKNQEEIKDLFRKLAVPRPDSGRQHRPDEGRGQVRVPARLQVLDLCHMVDPSGHYPRHRGSGPHYPYPGAYDRNDQQAHPDLPLSCPGTRARPDSGGNRGPHGISCGQGQESAQDRQGTHFPRNSHRRRGRFEPWGFHRGQEGRRARRRGGQYQALRTDRVRAGGSDAA